VPLSVRGDWDGSAEGVKKLLEKWGDAVHQERGKAIFPHLVVRRLMEEPVEIDEKTQPLSAKFLSLLQLAGSIRREGLLNPIQVYRQGDGGQIVAGERRWLAHHVLSLYDDDVEQWAMIPAVDTQKVDVWAQATENGRRAPLNAISMARQLALLVMDMYAGEIDFLPFEALVTDGSDRAFYAQVADGITYRIKRGMSDQILEVTGLTNRHAIGRYRDLLNLDDDTWMTADEEDWTEGACRKVLHPEYFDEKEPEAPENTDMLSNDNISKADPQNLETGQGYSQPYQPSTPPTPSNKMGAVPDSGEQIKIGQIRAKDAIEDNPYIFVTRELDRGDWLVIVHDSVGHHEQVISSKAIYEYWSVVLNYQPDWLVETNNTPQPPTSDIVQGQIRKKNRREDNGSYIVIVEEQRGGLWTVEFNYPLDGIQENRTFGESQIMSGWTVLLNERPAPADTTRTDEAIKQQGEVDLMGYGDTEYPEGDPVTFEPGRRPTHYPESTPQDDDWDEEPASRIDGSEHIPMATTTDYISTWLPHLKMMCMALGYQKQRETFIEMESITAEQIKQLHQEGGDKAVQALISAYGGAIDDMVNQLYFEAGTMLKMISAITNVPMPQVDEADDEA
jgi:hypothetical protein